jgi:hypothetical protein
MGIEQILSIAAESGAAVLLSVLIIYWYRVDTKAQIEAANEWRNLQREEKLQLATLMERYTEALTKLVVAVTEMRMENKENREDYRQEIRRLRSEIAEMKGASRNE